MPKPPARRNTIAIRPGQARSHTPKVLVEPSAAPEEDVQTGTVLPPGLAQRRVDRPALKGLNCRIPVEMDEMLYLIHTRLRVSKQDLITDVIRAHLDTNYPDWKSMIPK
jgi:hypothetical protein